MPKVVTVVVLGIMWVAWCIAAVLVVVPMLERHLTIYEGVLAWLLSVVPLIGWVIFFAVRTSARE